MRAVVVALGVSVGIVGCHKKIQITPEAIEKSPAAIVQQDTNGTSTWIVGSDGAVSALLKGPDNQPITKPVIGNVTFAPPNGTPATVAITYEPKTGVLVASGPNLAADLTPVTYDLTVDGTPWKGTIDVPRAGTQELVQTATLQAQLPSGKAGPNGGIVQMVGPDRVEIVANKSTGEVRAYVLDADFHVIDPGSRKITISVQGDQPEILVLAAEPHAHFVVGTLRTRIDPVRVTVAVTFEGATHACLVGWVPGGAVVVGAVAAPVHIMTVPTWREHDEDDDDDDHGHHRRVIVTQPGVVVETPGIVVGAPGVVVVGRHKHEH